MGIGHPFPSSTKVHILPAHDNNPGTFVAERPSENRALVKGKPPILTWDVFQRLCEDMTVIGQKSTVCRMHGITSYALDKAINQQAELGDLEWQELWDESNQLFRETVRNAAVVRHVEGVLEPVYNGKGELVGQVRRFSDKMGSDLLRMYFPEAYRTKDTATGAIGLEPTDAFTNLTAKAKREIRAIIMRDLDEQREAARAAEALNAEAQDAEFVDVEEEPDGRQSES